MKASEIGYCNCVEVTKNYINCASWYRIWLHVLSYELTEVHCSPKRKTVLMSACLPITVSACKESFDIFLGSLLN